MVTLRYVLASAIALLLSTACSGNKKNDTTAHASIAEEMKSQPVKTDAKALVVFFSHAGENYSVGNVKVGNTKIVADYISEFTGADQFEIECVKDYNMAYKPLCDLAKKEQEDGELPAFKGRIENLEQYETVFIGGPVWWGTYPQVMFTFFKTYDLNGKTIIPFTTHEGSGLGRCVEDVKTAYPKANVIGEFSMYGHDVREGKEDVEKWLRKLGYKKN
ncbi:MAG: NAD(P)H-dependent oxidoreductase [Prevotella sp.]|nr:NAD(P)H-dependent oxidoreductase [Prevotella sp.]